MLTADVDFEDGAFWTPVDVMSVQST